MDSNEEGASVGDFSTYDLPTIKRKFREHENFMKSLTESQDSVGRVLHRGQMLSQRLDVSEEQVAGILSQLHMVNERWERIREAAMHRQTALQLQLNRLQRQHLQDISHWLTQFEDIITSEEIQRLADRPATCRQQIAKHAQIQEQIERQQPSVRRLSTFIAVVNPTADEKEDVNELHELETLLHSTSKRWADICEWAEQRARHLDGLAELLEHHDHAYAHLSNWLAERQNDLKELCEADALIEEDEIRVQMNLLRKMETTLEKEHASFVELSRFCSELAQRFEQGKNPQMVNHIRGQLDAVTETWDQIVTRLEEHSQMLMNSEKVKAASRKRSGGGKKNGGSRRSSADSSSAASEAKLQKRVAVNASASGTAATANTVAVAAIIAPISSSSAPSSDVDQAAIVDEFVGQVSALEREIRPLFDWANAFRISTRREDIRQMVQLCHQKLKEIKEMEPRVTKTQIALERLHARKSRLNVGAPLDTDSLHASNEAFEGFMSKWSRIVACIGDALNQLSNFNPSGSEEGDVDMIMVRMSAWLKSANKALNAIAKEAGDNGSRATDEMRQRQCKSVDAIAEQLSEHQRHVGYLRTCFEDDARNAGGTMGGDSARRSNSLRNIERELIELVRRIESFRRGDFFVQSSESDAPAEANQRRLSRITTVVQMKQSMTSGEMDDTPPEESGRKVTVVGAHLTANSDATKAELTYSPEPSLNEAQSLKQRLEVEARERDEEAAAKAHKQPLSRADALYIWVSEREHKLDVNNAVPGDVSALKEELSRKDDLIAEVREKLFHEVQLNSKEDNIEADTAALERFLHSAEMRRNSLLDAINKTQLAIHKFVKAEECADRHKIAFDRIKMRMTSAASSMRSSVESIDDNGLATQENELKLLHEALTVEDWPLRSEAVNLLEDVAHSASTAEHAPQDARFVVVRDMEGRVARLASQWDELSAEVGALLNNLETAKRVRARKSLNIQLAVVAEMRNAVRASADATDAEELSEHLDNLERLLERLNSCEAESVELLHYIEDIASENGDASTTDAEIVTLLGDYRRQRDTTVPLARERCEQLRAAVTKCDEYEQALCGCQLWCNHMHHILSLRIGADIHALDVPHEYKQAFQSGTLFNQIDAEFADYDRLIGKLNDFIESSKSQWSSSDRLRLQSEHAAAQLAELRVKYNDFKQPMLLDDRMEQIERRLAQIECAIDDLTGIEAENCGYCLTHCEKLTRELGADDLGGKCAQLENVKDALIRETILSETNALEIADKITSLTQKCAQLEQRAQSTCEQLERSLKLLDKLAAENEATEKAVSFAEKIVVAAASGGASKKPFDDRAPTQGERVQQNSKLTTEQLARAGAQLRAAIELSRKARDFESLLRQNSIRLSESTLETLVNHETRILTLKRQLAVWAETIQTSSEDNQSALASFEKMADELHDVLMRKLEASPADLSANAQQPSSKLGADDDAPIYERLETKGLQLISRHSSEAANAETAEEEANIQRRVTHRLAELNVLRQMLERRTVTLDVERKMSAQASLHSKSNTPRKISKLPELSNVTRRESVVRDDAATHENGRYNANERKQSSASNANTANDASSISSSSASSSSDDASKAERLLQRKSSNIDETLSALALATRTTFAEFEKALAYLDFENYPLSSLEDWQERLKLLSAWMSANRPQLEELLADGRRIADSGRMELRTHDVLDELDRLVTVANKIDADAVESDKQLHVAESKRGDLRDGIAELEATVTRLQANKLDASTLQSTDILAIQRELMEACSRLRVLQHAASQLHAMVPITTARESPTPHEDDALTATAASVSASGDGGQKALSIIAAENTFLDELNAQLRVIEDRVQEALHKALEAQEAQSAICPQSADRMSLSSGAGLSLAMDVHETEPEEDESKEPYEELESGKGSEEKSDKDLNQFFVNLDAVEEHLEKPDHLPFEALDEKAAALKDFDAELARGEEIVESQQMTMGLAEREHALQRIQAARAIMEKRRAALVEDRVALEALETHVSDVESLIVELGAAQRRRFAASPKGISKEENGRNHSPDLDELEAGQLEMEDQLPPIAVRMQQATNRLEALASKFSTTMANDFQERLAQCRVDFSRYSQDVRDSRRHLEERLADQTHLNRQLEMLEFWCDETEAGVVGSNVRVSILSAEAQLVAMLREAAARHAELPEKLNALKSLENSRDRFVALANVEPEIKHEIRRSVAQVAKRVSDLKFDLGEKLSALQNINRASETFWRDFARIDNWLAEGVAQLDAVRDAKIYRPSLVNIEKLYNEAAEHRNTLEQMQEAIRSSYEALANASGTLDKKERTNQQKFENLMRDFEAVTENVGRVLNETGDLPRLFGQSADELGEEGDRLADQLNNNSSSIVETVKAVGRASATAANDGSSAHPSSTAEYGTLSCGGSSNTINQALMNGGVDEINNNHIFDANDVAETAQYAPLNNEMSGAPTTTSVPLYRGGSERASQRRPRKMSVSEQARLDTVTRFMSWLEELKRDAGVSVDLADQNLIRQGMGRAQNWMDELEVSRVEVLRVVDEASDKLVHERAQLCAQQMDRVMGMCQQRRGVLQAILEECRAWEQLRLSIEMWLTEADDKLTSGAEINELTDAGLVEQLEEVGQLREQAHNWHKRLERFNNKSNAMLDTYRRDDGHNLSHITSRLNTHWTKFNDALRIRRAILEAAQHSRKDFHTALGQAQQWLERQWADVFRLDSESDNAQLLKDSSRRREWMAQEKEARAEIDAHRALIDKVRQMGAKLLNEQGASEEREQLRERLQNVDAQWRQLTQKQETIKERLENAQEECEALTQGLSDFLFWTEQQLKTIEAEQPVGGDLPTVQRQFEVIKTIERTMEARRRGVEDCIQLAHSYLMQHDLRPPIHTPSTLVAAVAPDIHDAITLTDAQREERRVGLQIHADSERLKTTWALLNQQCANWAGVVLRAHKDMHALDATIAEALLALGAVEDDVQRLPDVESLRLEELKDARLENANIRKRAHDASTRLDDVNDCAGQIIAKNVALTAHLEAQIQAINLRFEKLKQTVTCRGAALERAFNDFGPSSEHFLMDSVAPPWQRAISSPHSLPYYIDHNTEVTQWDHPAIVDILEQLSTFNQVKFSAYRTAMKLRAIQKRLCLDLIELPELDDSLQKRLHSCAHEDHMRMEDAVTCLVPLFEAANARFPHLLKNVPLAVDLTLNLLLNIYDACRDGKMRVLSFKVALVVMCNATLESKYKYLYHLVSAAEGVDQKALAILFYDLIHLPKFLGESAAFGGLNIEPSVRSCFEHARFSLRISVDEFLEWLRKEPQSLVWLPVMHRLASSEFAKHSAKCNACKMFPIVGMRYRCLRCFNFDICQSCFFSQRTAKNHKLTHPMQEYCLPTNSRDDVRDFTAMVRNKVRRAKSRVGYLPVEQAIEGAPLEQSELTPQNAASETMHQRMHLFAQRLDAKRAELEASRDASPKQQSPPLFELRQNDSAERDVSKGIGAAKSVSIGALPLSVMSARRETANEAVTASGGKSGNGKVDLKSPSQIMKEAELMRKEELDQVLQKLQYENMRLKADLEKRRRAAGVANPAHSAKSTPNLSGVNDSAPASLGRPQRPPTIIQQEPADGEYYYPDALTAQSVNSTALIEHGAQGVGVHAASIHFDGGGSGKDGVQTLTRVPPPPPPHGIASRYAYATTLGSVGATINGGGAPLANVTNFNNNVAAESSRQQVEEDPDELNEKKAQAETRCLRMHQQRLEQRSRILEDHNRQLQQHLERLQSRLINDKQKSMGALTKLDENAELEIAALNGGGGIPPPPLPLSYTTLPSMYAGYGTRHGGYGTTVSTPFLHYGNRAAVGGGGGGAVSSSEDDDPLGRYGTEIRRHHMQTLMSTMDELNQAMESFVGTVVMDPEDPIVGDNADDAVENENESGSNAAESEFRQKQLVAN